MFESTINPSTIPVRPKAPDCRPVALLSGFTKLIFRTMLSPGDVLMLTATVRDLHAAYPGRFETDVRTSAPALWRNNPHITPLDESAPDVQTLDVHYPLIHESNFQPVHFLRGYTQYLENRLGLRIPTTRFSGDIHLSPEELEAPCQLAEAGVAGNYWIMIAGGKYDFTAKWWNPESYQTVVDRLAGRVHFVQCGEYGHWHPKLRGVTDFVGRTSLRQFVLLMHHAAGVLCPVTLAMHLAAAVPMPHKDASRPCVVIAGGREPPHWEAYPQHQFIHTVGALSCCSKGGCWKSRCQQVGEGEVQDRSDVCEQPIDVTGKLRIPRCMHMITPADVVQRILLHFQDGRVDWCPAAAPTEGALNLKVLEKKSLLVEFFHGIGDAVQLTVVLKHLQLLRPNWEVDLVVEPGVEALFAGQCRHVFTRGDDQIDPARYHSTYRLDWSVCRVGFQNVPSTAAIQCLRDTFFLTPVESLCTYRLEISETARKEAREYLQQVAGAALQPDQRFKAVVIYLPEDSSSDIKNMVARLVNVISQSAIQTGAVPIIASRSQEPDFPAEMSIVRLSGNPLEQAAVVAEAALVVGIDSGCVRLAGALGTPAVAAWVNQHPIHCVDRCDNVIHLVPEKHHLSICGKEAAHYFREHYRHRVYSQLEIDIGAAVESELGGVSWHIARFKRFLAQFPKVGFGQHYYHEAKGAGHDYLHFGRWQVHYGTWLTNALGLSGKQLLDVGCACGALTRAFRKAGVQATGVDVSEFMVSLGREKWPDTAPFLFVGDMLNLHTWPESSFDFIHLTNAIDRLSADQVPLALRELRRVVRAKGGLFCTLFTDDQPHDWKATLPKRDDVRSTRPRSWWKQQFEAAGWRDDSAAYEETLDFQAGYGCQHCHSQWFVMEARESS